ncbi:MAG: Hsp20/alpha crystallin family protein [Acutalibacteraceae bacterium]|nr:Hsp20/alpha crystallin family protein [Acutalibacteraceae bacterium]
MSTWLTSYNPFDAMDNFEKNFFNDPFFTGNGNRPIAFGTDITDEGDSYQLTADLPGFKKEDIHVGVDKNVVSVTAERHSEAENSDKRDKFIRKERSYGSYKRSFTIGENVDTSAIRAAYDNGVLTLTLPKKVEEEQKTFDIVVE